MQRSFFPLTLSRQGIPHFPDAEPFIAAIMPCMAKVGRKFSYYCHEFLHHLDYMGFKLADSFHTEGFYKRESELIRDLMMSTGRTGGNGDRPSGPPVSE